MRYLLAAEADKIQEFVFRSSRLREVVGASQLLSRFCNSEDGALALARQHGGVMVVNDGGSFRVIFDGDNAQANALAFGSDLAELYRLSLGGSLSVADPVPLNGDFRAANEQAGKKLRHAKNRRQGVTAEVHMPYVAFCASCGLALADHHGQLPHDPGDTKRYLCSACQIKALERWEERLGQLYELLIQIIPSEEHLDQYTWPRDADQAGAYDPRGYVAYLVADGNSMGTLFSQCDETQISDLSRGMTKAARSSLATASSSLIARLDRRYDEKQHEVVPVLPLILGGDDIFALIPAPYALDFARRFCLAWETELAQLVQSAGLEIGKGDGRVARPTVAAAVVICRSKYPYALAHRRADELLAEAKRHCKLLAAQKGENLSAVNFAVILGNRLAGQEEMDAEIRAAILPTLRPYWIASDELPTDALERGVDLQVLLAQRYALKNVPNKRLAELRRRFENLPTESDTQELESALEKWSRALETFVARSGKVTGSKLRAALTTLGRAPGSEGDAHHWRALSRGDDSPLAHGIPDLLETWDFAQNLDYYPDEYDPEEESE